MQTCNANKGKDLGEAMKKRFKPTGFYAKKTVVCNIASLFGVVLVMQLPWEAWQIIIEKNRGWIGLQKFLFLPLFSFFSLGLIVWSLDFWTIHSNSKLSFNAKSSTAMAIMPCRIARQACTDSTDDISKPASASRSSRKHGAARFCRSFSSKIHQLQKRSVGKVHLDDRRTMVNR